MKRLLIPAAALIVGGLIGATLGVLGSRCGTGG